MGSEFSVKKMNFMFWVLAVLVIETQLIRCSVTYDRKALVINGQRKILISGSIHYPRSTPEVHFLFPTDFSQFPGGLF